MEELEPNKGGGVILAHIPERFCSVHIHTSGGHVTLQGLTEAALEVDTGGGDLSAGKVKAIRADLTTQGGALSGTVTAGGMLTLATRVLASMSFPPENDLKA